MSSYLIGLMGAARAGKDTVANYLATTDGFERRSFASALKDMCRTILAEHPMPCEVQERRSDGERWPIGADAIDEKTPFGRWFLQTVGTDIVRAIVPGYWINSLLANDGGLPKRLVIPDVRFPDEYAAIRERGGVVWRVERTGWTENAAVAAHVSEQAWRKLVPDDVVSAPSGDIRAVEMATYAAWARLQAYTKEERNRGKYSA